MNPMTNVRNTQKLNERELDLGLTGSASSWHNEFKDSAWIFVGGLPYDLTEGDIIAVFSQYGEIVNINLVRDKGTGKSKGFCFICYEDQRSTILAVDNFNSIKLLNRTLRVNHVADYRMPKEHENDDAETLALREAGCAPKVKDSSSEDEQLEIQPVKKNKKDKKKKKEKKKKKKKKAESSSDSTSSDEPQERQRSSGGQGQSRSRVKVETDDPGYLKYASVKRSHSDSDDEPMRKYGGDRSRVKHEVTDDTYAARDLDRCDRRGASPSYRRVNAAPTSKDRHRDGDRQRQRDRSQGDRERSREQHQSRDRSRERDKFQDQYRYQDRSRERNKMRERDRYGERDRSRERDCSFDRDRHRRRDRSQERERPQRRERSTEQDRSRERYRGDDYKQHNKQRDRSRDRDYERSNRGDDRKMKIVVEIHK